MGFPKDPHNNVGRQCTYIGQTSEGTYWVRNYIGTDKDGKSLYRLQHSTAGHYVFRTLDQLMQLV